MRIGINCLPMNDRMGGLRQYAQRLIRELLEIAGVTQYIDVYDTVEAAVASF